MQKKLIAAAVAALASTAAMAQVTLYGVADAGYFMLNQERTPTGAAAGQVVDAKTSGIYNGILSGSRLGVKAEDDIGGGMKGVVVYETAVNIDANGTAAGSSGMFGITRQSYVGVSGGFGRVSFGRQYAPGYFAALASDGFAGAAISPQSALSAANSMMITPNSGARVDNSINWVSNSMGGVTLNVLYGMGETADTPNVTAAGTTSKTNQRVGIGAQGKFGPLTVDAVYETKENALAATNGTQTQDEYLIGAAFNAGFATFGASYQVKELDGGAVTPASTNGNDSELVSVSAIVPIGAGNIHVGYAMLTRDTTVESEITAMTVAYTHALSKKTTAYIGYGQVEANESVSAVTATGVGGPWGALIANGTNSVYTAGLRVVF